MTTILWKTGASGLWTTGADWSGGAAPGASDDVVIAVAPATAGLPYTVTLNSDATVNSVAMQQQLATLDVYESTLTVGRTFALSAGTLELDYGTLLGNSGATVTAGAATTVAVASGTSGTISNLLWRGALNVGGPTGGFAGGTYLYLDGVTFAGASGTGAGTLSLGAGISADVGSSSELVNVDVSLANGARLTSDFSASITLASTTTLSVGAYAAGSIDASAFVNAGVISVSGTAALLSITQYVSQTTPLFDNTGTISVSNGAVVNIESTTATNSGLISIASGGFLEIGPVEFGGANSFTNTGTITDHGGTLDLNVPLDTAQLAAFGITDGTLAIAGALDNSGATLSSGSGAGASAQNLLLDGGTISGGTIVNTGAFSIDSGTLSGVALQGPLDVVGSALTIESSFSLASGTAGGASTISVQNTGSVTFATSQTLSHTVIDLNGSIDVGSYNEATAATLTLASGTTLTQTGFYADLDAYNAGDVVLNKGTLNLAYAGGEFSADGLVNQGRITVSQGDTLSGIATNSGTISAGTAIINGEQELGAPDFLNSGMISDSQAGGTLAFGGSLDNNGTIAVSNGATLALNDATQDSYNATFTNTGVVSVTNGVLLANSITSSQLETIELTGSSVIATGRLVIDGGAPLRVGAGTALGSIKLSGTIADGTVIDSGQGIVFYGAATLDNVTYQGTLDITRPFTTLTVLDSFAATSGASGTAPGLIELTGAATVLDWRSTQALDNATLAIGGNASLPILGSTMPTFLADTAVGPTLLGAHLTIVHVGGYHTSATIGGADGQNGYSSAAGTIASAATIRADARFYSDLYLEGASFSSTGTIIASNGDTIVDGATAFGNAGTIVIGYASTFIVNTLNYYASATFANTPFTNSGTIALTGGTLAEDNSLPLVPIRNTGTISDASTKKGPGAIDAPIVNAGTITVTSGTLNVNQNISGVGHLIVGDGATLNLNYAVGSGQRVVFGGASGVFGLAPAEFHGTFVSFAAGDAIDLGRTAASGARFSGDSIVVTLSAGGTITLATASALSGSLATLSDGHGGTLIEFAGSVPAADDPSHPELAWSAPLRPNEAAQIASPLHWHALPS